MNIAELKVTTRFGQVLLGPLSLEVEKPCRLVVVGRSGSGKSTLLAALSGVSVHLVEGRLDGVPISAASQGRRLLAVQEGSEAFTPYRRVGAQLRDALRPDETTQWTRAMGEALELLGLETGVLSSYPGELSGGMLKRVLLAGVWAARPQILMLDEPTSGIDPSTRLEVWRLLDRLPCPLVVATHDWEEAIPLANATVVRLEAGRLVERWRHNESQGGAT